MSQWSWRVFRRGEEIDNSVLAMVEFDWGKFPADSGAMVAIRRRNGWDVTSIGDGFFVSNDRRVHQPLRSDTIRLPTLDDVRAYVSMVT